VSSHFGPKKLDLLRDLHNWLHWLRLWLPVLRLLCLLHMLHLEGCHTLDVGELYCDSDRFALFERTTIII
jgi:hypothetical protein